MTALAMSFQETKFSVVDRNGQVWLRASELAEALGYARPDALNKIYERNADEFTASMTTNVKMTFNGINNSLRETDVRIFSLRGAHLIAMFARTAVAKEFRRWVLDILDREVLSSAINKRIAITPEQQADLKEVVRQRAQGCRKAYAEMWARHNRHFKIGKYDQLLQVHFDDAKRYLQAMDLKSQPEPVQPVIVQPAQPHPIIQDVYDLCINMLWVNSWWQRYGDGVRALNPNIANAVHDRFVYGCTEANMLLRQMERAGSAKAINAYPWHEPVEVRNSYWLRHGK